VTCGVYVANAARSDIQLAQRRPRSQQQLADLFDVDLAPRIIPANHARGAIGNRHAFAGGLLQRSGIAMCGLMQKCASPAREAGLPTYRSLASAPKHPRASTITARSQHPEVTTGDHAGGQLFEPPLQAVITGRVFYYCVCYYGAEGVEAGVGHGDGRPMPSDRPPRSYPTFPRITLHHRWKSRFKSAKSPGDILCIDYYEACQRKKLANRWSSCHSRIERPRQQAQEKNAGIPCTRFWNWQFGSLASGRGGLRYCDGQPSGF
jgi:hypothetical protein